jgi:MFS family permease
LPIIVPMRTRVEPSAASATRSIAALAAGVALMQLAVASGNTVASLFTAEAAGDGWGGVPNTAAVLGTAAGALLLSAYMSAHGRRRGLRLGYGVSALGAALAVVSINRGSVPFLLLGMVMLGAGNASAQLSRYAAAEVADPNRRGLALGAVVWAGTVGAVLGPALIPPAASLGSRLDLDPLAGIFVVALVVTSMAALVIGAMRRTAVTPSSGTPRRPPFDLLRLPRARVALVAMLTGQLTMVAVMTMTPLHIHHHGHGLGRVGFVISAHTLGMFALSPLSGWLTDRLGSMAVIFGGFGTLAVSLGLAIVSPGPGSVALPIALFLLGYGWNLCLVGGSRLLAGHGDPAEETRVQGLVDALVWATSALATLGSGPIFAAGGYRVLSGVAGLLVAAAAVVLVRRRPLKGATA